MVHSVYTPREHWRTQFTYVPQCEMSKKRVPVLLNVLNSRVSARISNPFLYLLDIYRAVKQILPIFHELATSITILTLLNQQLVL